MVKCDASDKEDKRCILPACFNYQRVWVRYGVDADDNYTRKRKDMPELEEPIEENNLHYCRYHAKEFEAGER